MIAEEAKNGTLTIENITESTIDSKLTTNFMPDPDLLIRTGGELRISNYLLWQCAYSEFYFTDQFWPDFNEEFLKEDVVKYTISFNGKARFTLDFAVDATNAEIEAEVLANENSQKYIDGKPIRKVIIVPKKIVNIVI